MVYSLWRDTNCYNEDYRSAYFHITLRNVLISVNYFAVDFMRSETVMLCTNFMLLHSDVSQLQLKHDL